MRAPFDPYGAASPAIDQQLGDAFQVVRFVARHIPEIASVAYHMEGLYKLVSAGGKANADLLGLPPEATNLGEMEGNLIPDGATVYAALQIIATFVENLKSQTDNLLSDMGQFTGITIPDNLSLHDALQALETSIERVFAEAPVLSTQEQAEEGTDNTTVMSPLRTRQAIQSLLDRLDLFDAALAGKVPYSVLGIDDEALNMGTFPGNIIPDNSSVKAALTSLETELARVDGEYLDLSQFGADFTGVEDSTEAVTAWLTEAAAQNRTAYSSKGGTVRLTAPVEIPPGVTIQGPSGTYMAATLSGVLTFLLDHSGMGFTITGPTEGRSINGIATKRNQPAVAAGWAPGAFDWDFYVSGATDVSFTDVLIVNGTKGIICTNGGGRFSFIRVWGQPMEVGIQVDVALDVVRYQLCHFWPFWSEETPVVTWQLANGTAFYSKRNDNPEAFGLFSIGYRYGLRIGQWTGGAAGTTSRFRGFGLGFDAGGAGLSIDGDCNGAQLDMYGFYAHGHDSIFTGGSGIDIYGTNANVQVHGKVDISNAHKSAISLSGSGSSLTIGSLLCRGWNLSNTAAPALYVADVAWGLRFETGDYSISGGLYSAATFSMTGRYWGITRDFASVVSAGSGAFGSTPVVNLCHYRLLDDQWCEFSFDIFVSNIGSATDVRMSLPYASTAAVYVGFVQDGSTGMCGAVKNFANTTSIVFNKYDGTAWNVNNINLRGTLKYRVN